METKEKEAKVGWSLPLVCPDYDEECRRMPLERVEWCYEGLPGNPHQPQGLGKACGICPILSEANN